MGYYINIRESHLGIPTDKLDAALQAGKDLNQDNSKKNGGSWPRDESVQGPDPGFHFSWVDWNYDQQVESVEDVLAAFRFCDGEASQITVTESDGVTWFGLYYDSKAGDEEYLLDALAPFIVDGSFIVWQGEEGDIWRDFFKDGKRTQQVAEVSFPDVT